jgi:nucleotide-binding universal stress UspA family protein
MRKILVPTDFSDCAGNAAKVALQIAQKAKAQVDFLHILVTPIDWVSLDLQKEKRYPEVKKKIGLAKFVLQKWMKRAQRLGLESENTLTFSQGTEAIVRYAQDHQYDLIVMGSHGASGFKEAVLGSNAQRLVTEATTPVLIIKNKIEEFKIENILFSSTFKEDVHHPFHHIIDFADLMKAQINLLFVNDRKHFEESRKSENRMKSFLDKCPRGTCSINVYNDSSPETGILHFAEDRKIDLIAIVTHGKKGLFQSGLTERLVNHSQLPVLSVNILL